MLILLVKRERRSISSRNLPNDRICILRKKEERIF